MRETRLAALLALSLLMALGSACKKGRDTANAADETKEPPPAPPASTSEDMLVPNLEDTQWDLVELNGKPIHGTVHDRAPYLELNSKKASAYGFGGCNRFFGSYEATDRSLKLGALGATRMACPEGMDREQELFTALASTTRYEIHGSELLLFADDALVARFEARRQSQ